MRKVYGAATAVALALAAGAASAAEWTGTIEQIDEVSRNIIVSNSVRPDQIMTFAVSDTNTVGATIEDLREGDTVRVFYAESGTESGIPVNAMQIDQVAAADTAARDTAVREAATPDAAIRGDIRQGTLEQIGGDSITVSGVEYPLGGGFMGVPLEQLEEGDEVKLVVRETDPRDIVELTKVE
ncbi:MAG: hypothetical protein ACREJ5_22490 [Geminicoccaceae bacterium]